MKFRFSFFAVSAAILGMGLQASLALTPGTQRVPGVRANSLNIANGRLRVTLGPNANLRLLVDGIPVITESSFYLVKPGWTGIVLNPADVKPQFTVAKEGDTQIGTAVFENADGYARYRLEVRPDNTLTIKLTYGTNGAPAQVEYAAGLLNANVIAGCPFQAVTVAGTKNGTVPIAATTADQTASRVTPFFKQMRIGSRLGPMTITVVGNTANTSAINLFDTRKGTQDFAVHHPVFWMGIGAPALNISPGENISTLTLAFGPAPRRTVAPAITKAVEILNTESAQVPFSPDRPLIPRPKEVENGTTALRLQSGKSRIVIPTDPVAEEKTGSEELRSELATFWGLDVPVVVGNTPEPGDIVLGRAAILRAVVPERPEGYLLQINETGAVLAGNDPRGVYDAVQTAKQLIRVDTAGVYLKSVTIRDWPTLLWRGVHWYGGPNSWPFHQRMIDRIVAPLKYNEMVTQVEYTAWDSQPKLRDYRSTPKADTKKSLEYARAHFFDPIPLIPSLGHMEWMFLNNQNLDIAADPTHPYSLDPENPHSYDVLFGVMQETIDLFHPKQIAIGHDEVTLVGTFPKPSSKKTITELYGQNVNTIYDWLAKRGIKTMMWGDMMLHATEGSGGAAFAPTLKDAAIRRASVPKDVLIADWHYYGPDYPSIKVLQRDGFGLVASTWYNPTNIQDFARAAAKENAKGLLQTTWAGFTMSLDLVKGESLAQFVAYLIGAEHAWNGGANDFETLGYSPQDAFLTLWDRQPVDRKTHSGFVVDLSGVGNAESLDKTLSGEKVLGGVCYQTGKSVWLAGALNGEGVWPSAVTISLGNRKAASLNWLWGTALPTTIGARVANLTVTYVDGKTMDVPLLYGKHLSAFSDRRGSSNTRSVGTGHGASGEPLDLRDWSWQNPRPESAIASVTLTATGTEAAPVLLALTGIE
jgi:hexosaminidase